MNLFLEELKVTQEQQRSEEEAERKRKLMEEMEVERQRRELEKRESLRLRKEQVKEKERQYTDMMVNPMPPAVCVSLVLHYLCDCMW